MEHIGEILQRFRLKNVYIATDADAYLVDMRANFPNVKFASTTEQSKPQLDLCILERSAVFLANCVSSFSSFVRRSRDVAAKPTFYFGLISKLNRGEL